jgi:hypothetical protein
MSRYAVGLVLKKADPGRALTHFDEAADLAASVRNFWWHGIAMMEAAAWTLRESKRAKWKCISTQSE